MSKPHAPMFTLDAPGLRRVQFANFGRVFHTGLRKLCESDPTSLLYNAIRLADNKTWVALSEVIRLRCEPKTYAGLDELAAAVGTAWHKADTYLSSYQDEGKVTPVDYTSWWVLVLAGRMLSTDDWRRACGYLWSIDSDTVTK